MKKFLLFCRWLSYGMGILLVLGIVAVVVYTHTAEFRELLRQQMIAAVNGSIRGKIAIERVDGSIWGALTLHHVRLRYGGTDILEVPRLKIGYSLIPLIWGRVQIFTFEGFQPLLRLNQDKAGVWNITDAVASSQPEADLQSQERSGFVVLLNSLILRDARIDLTVADRDQQTYSLRDAELNARLEIRPAGVELDVRQLASRLILRDLPEIGMKGSLAYRDTALPATLQFKEFWVESGDSRVKLTGKVADLETLAMEAKISIEKLTPSDLARFFPDWPIQRNVTGTVDVNGPPSALQGDLALAVADAKISGNFQVDVASDSPRYSAALNIADFDLRNLVGTEGFNGILNGLIKANGAGASFTGLRGRGELNIRSAEAGGWSLGDIALTGNVDRRVAKLAGELKGEIGGASWRGEIAFQDKPQYDLALAVKNLNVKKVSSGVFEKALLEGKVNLKGTIKGAGLTLPEMATQTEIEILPSVIGPVNIEHGMVVATLANQRIRLTQATISAEDAKLVLKGEIGTDLNKQGSIDYHLRVGALSPWLSLMNRRGSGTFEVNGRARGNLAQLKSRGKVKLAALNVEGFTLAQGSINFDLNGLTLQSPPQGTLRATLAGIQAGVRLQKLETAIRLSDKRPFSLQVDAKAQDLAARTHKVSARIDYQSDQIIAHLIQLDLTLPDGTWKLSRPATVTKRADGFLVDQFSLQNRNQRITLDGLFSLTGRQSLTLSIAGLPLEALHGFLLQRPRVTGVLSARAELSGSAAAPEITGTVELNNATIAGQSYAGVVAAVAYKEKIAKLKATLHQDSAHTLNVAGALPLAVSWINGWQAHISGNLDLRIHSTGLSVAFLNAFTGESVQELTGQLALDISARGTVAQPAFQGTFALRHAGMKLNLLNIQVSSMTVHGVLDGQTIEIRQMAARAKEGRLEGSGFMALKNHLPENLKLSLTLDRWPAIATHRYQAVVGGKVNLEGPWTKPKISGNVEVHEAKLRPDLAFLERSETPITRDKTITVVQQDTPGDPPPFQPPESEGLDDNEIFRNAKLDLDVVLIRNVWIRHPSANAELSGEIKITKQAKEQVTLAGTIELVRGWVGFQGRRFNLVQGKIVFTGAEKIDPSLDILAQYRLRDYTVEAVVSGTVEKPGLILRSQPRLDQADILALLLFGKPIRELNQGEQVSLQQSAIDITSGYAAARIGTAVAQALGLERLGIEIGDFDFTGGRIGYGRYVTRKAYVSLSQELVDERGREFSVEYQIAPDWKIRSSTSPTGDRGVDIFWHKEY